MITLFWVSLWSWQHEMKWENGFEVISLSGTVEPQQEMLMAAQVLGEVAEIPAHPGSDCRAGEVLILLRPAGQSERIEAAEQTLESAFAAETLAQQQVERLDRLRQSGAVSELQFEESRIKLRSARAETKSAQALLQGEQELYRFLEMRAPFDGNLTDIFVSVGTRVKSGQPLARIVGPKARSIKVIWPGRLIDVLSTAKFELRIDEKWLPTQSSNQQSSFQSTGNMLVYLQADHGLMPYQRPQVRALIEIEGLFLRPGQWEQRGAATFVHVQVDQEVQRRLVRLGPTLPEGKRQVMAGLRVGDIVIAPFGVRP